MTHVHLPFTPRDILWPHPWVWALTLLALLPWLWWLWLRPQRRGAIRFSDLTSVRHAAGRVRSRLPLLLPVLRTVALTGLIVAVARPQTPNESRRLQVEGIAIQMILDTSGSMLDLDLSPPDRRMTRLDVAKEVFRRFVLGNEVLPGRPNDLVGMIRFAKYADSVCPLTLDHGALSEILDQTHIPVDRYGRVPDEHNQTAIGDALALAVERLKDLKRTTGSGGQLVIRSRVAILLTDGENNAGMIAPQQAGELAATFGIRVYTILCGTGQNLGWGHRLPVDDRDLKYIANVTGGRHYVATDERALERVYQEIDQLERTKTEEHSYVEWGERSWAWLATAFVALCAQTVLNSTLLRRIP